MMEGVCSRLLNLGLQKKVSQSIGIIVRCFVAGSSMTNPPKKQKKTTNNQTPKATAVLGRKTSVSGLPKVAGSGHRLKLCISIQNRSV